MQAITTTEEQRNELAHRVASTATLIRAMHKAAEQGSTMHRDLDRLHFSLMRVSIEDWRK